MTHLPTTTEYLQSTLQALWPAPAEWRLRLSPRVPPAAACSWFVLPSIRRPRLLVPVDTRSSARMLRRRASSRRDAAVRSMLRAAISSGVLRRLPAPRLVVQGTAGVTAHLEQLLGEPISVGILLGTERANRKPVLQVFDRAGTTRAFVKVALTPQTAALVSNEAAALQRLAAARLQQLQAPEVLSHATWRDVDLLALSALPAAQTSRQKPDAELGAMAEIAALPGIDPAPISSLLQRYRQQTDGLPPGSGRDRVRRAVESLGGHGHVSILLGAWHGDWAPWNMGRCNGRLQVWDWERFATGIPLGYDALHYQAQLSWHQGADSAEALARLDSTSTTAMRAFGRQDRPPQLVTLYLVEISLRYLADQPISEQPRPRTRWVLDQLDHALATLSPEGFR